MTSADFLQFVVTMFRFGKAYSFAPASSPRVSVTTFASYICRIYILKFGQYRTLLCYGSSSLPICLICDSCSSDRGFARGLVCLPTSGFLQIPPHDGHPCLRLTVPTAMSVADFHRQVVTHAERTKRAWEQRFYSSPSGSLK